MSLLKFFSQKKLEHTILVGYYGGGNYGDELLLEVLQQLLYQQGVKNVTVTYQYPKAFASMHQDLGYNVVDIRDKLAVMRQTIKNKNIIIGGGALWGVDMNLNTLILSFALLCSRWLLGKNVYLIGIGYHNSTSTMGRIGAWCAGKAATAVMARDDETFVNFRKITKHTFRDKDIAWYANDEMNRRHEAEAKELGKRLGLHKKSLFIALRRIQAGKQAEVFANYNKQIEETIAENSDKQIIIAPLELERVSPDEYVFARQLQQRYKNVQILDMPYNPLTLFYVFRLYSKNLVLVGPQFHIILTAFMGGTPFIPLVYDNKVHELLKQMEVKERLPLKHLTQDALQQFIDKEFAKL